jgi:hypothetical protein
MDFESSVETDVIEVESSTALVTLQLHSFRWERPTVSHFHSPVAGLLDLALPTRLPSGRGRYADDRVQKRVLGDIFYVPRNLRLEGYAGAGRQRSLWCLLQTQRISELGEIDDVFPSFENCSDVANPEIRTNLLRMGNELAHPGFASALLIDALAISTFVELQRHMRGAGNYKPSGVPQYHGRDCRRLHRPGTDAAGQGIALAFRSAHQADFAWTRFRQCRIFLPCISPCFRYVAEQVPPRFP